MLLWESANLGPSLSQIEPSIGPAPFITADMVLSSVQKMKLGKSPGGSNIIAEISKASPDQCNQLIPVLINAIVKEGKVPEEFNNRYMVSLFKGKGSTLQRGNCRGLKLTDHMLKLMERVTEKITRECIVIDNMQFGFMPGRGQLMLSSLSDNFRKRFWTKKPLFCFH